MSAIFVFISDKRSACGFCSQVTYLCLKELCHGLCILKSSAFSFQIRPLQSVLIFSILCHPCSFMVYHYLFDVFLSYQTIIFKFRTI